MQPYISYLICATPRTGSYLLCEALAGTGLAGYPKEPFFPNEEPFYSQKWNGPFFEDYLTRIIEEGTTSNGVFGLKVMWSYFEHLVTNIRLLHEPVKQDTAEILSTAFPHMHYIYITRRDKVKQAVSYWKAKQTLVWTVLKDEPKVSRRKPVFNFTAIDQLVQDILSYEAYWKHYFETYNIQPFQVVYEELVSNYEETTLQILKYLGIRLSEPIIFAERRLIKQADALSEDWIQRYYTLKQTT